MHTLTDVEKAIVDRLKLKLPATISVQPLRIVSKLEEQLIPTPSVLVSCGESEVVELTRDARTARLKLPWYITAVERSLADGNDSLAANAIGETNNLTMSALMGWKPLQACAPMRLNGVLPQGFGGGYLWTSIVFATEFVFTATED